MTGYNFGFANCFGFSGSSSLAQILYQTSLGDFTYNTDASGNIVLTNQGSFGTSYDALPYSGRGIELGALNDVDIPIHYTLGTELVTNGTFDTDTDWTKGTGWTIAAGVASSDGTQVADSLLTTLTIPTTVAGDTYLISFEVTAYTAGNVALQFDGIEIIPDKAEVGVYSAEAIASDTTGTIDIVADLDFVGSVDNVTVKQITNPDSYLTYYDFTDGLVTVDNSLNTPSTKYTINTKTVNSIITHTTPWSASDWAMINNNPNLVGKLALETLGATKTIPELDMVMDAGASADSYYMCSEKSGAYLVDSRVAYGVEEVKTGLLATDFNGLNSTDAVVGEWLEVTTTAVDTLSMFTYLTTQTSPNITNMPDDLNDIVVMEFTAYCDVGITGTIETVRTSPIINVPLETTPTTYTFIFKYIDNPYFKFATTVGTGKLYLKVPDGSLSIRKATATEIANYAPTVRTNADLQQKGIQTTAFVTDGAGVCESYTSNILNFTSLEYIDSDWNPSLESTFWLEEVIAGVAYQHKYDGTNLTTYTDNVAGTPALHSPENASYLLGKGVYPKVTADPYTSYQAKTFQLHNGTRYTNYDQEARYAILAAL